MGDPQNIALKVCGMREPKNIMAVAELNPDYMGFIFYSGSKRFVGDDFKIPSILPASIARVGVFVNESTEGIFQVAARHNLEWIQLHGNESTEHCQQIRSEGLKVIKAFGIGDDFDFGTVEAYDVVADYLMFDAKGANFGGNGRPFDWTMLDQYHLQKPYFLSGGISPSNVEEIRNLSQRYLHAIDVNSGVEEIPGVKNIGLIKDIKVKMHVNSKSERG